MTYPFIFSATFCAVMVLLQFASIAMTVVRFNRRDAGNIKANEGISILRPVCGIENYIEETLRSTFQLDYPQYEILFCVADAGDPVIPVVRRLIAAYPHVDAQLLIGNTNVSANPKLNNLIKGWHAAHHDWVLMADSNVRMPKDHLQRMLSAWQSDTGLVCSPPVGGAPDNLWAELECAFLNTYQARWQCVADSLGFGFAQGKAMLWRRDLLNRAGGIEVLGSELAEDAAATKAVRSLGLHVRLVSRPFTQPLGRRSPMEVWRRQVRWARLRRTTFKLFFIPELFAGVMPMALAAAIVAQESGWPILATVVPLMVAWYAAEAGLAYRAGWHFSRWSIPIWMLRDALLPALWMSAWIGDEFEWRGNAMSVAMEAAP